MMTDQLIQEYFQAEPKERLELLDITSKQIDSPQKVLAVLNWSRARGVKDAYDGALGLLARCGIVLLETIDEVTPKGDAIAYEERVEVLIKGIAYARNIPAQERLKAIVDLIPATSRQLVKAAIVDALILLEDEMGTDTVKGYLSLFSSASEADEYIRQYANTYPKGCSLETPQVNYT